MYNNSLFSYIYLLELEKKESTKASLQRKYETRVAKVCNFMEHCMRGIVY